MPCKKGTRGAPEDFDIVRQRWRRRIVPDSKTASAQFAERYAAGDMEAVWREIHGLDLREPVSEHIFKDIVECVRMTMRRVRSNIELLIPALSKLGYEFCDPEQIHVPPTDTDRAILKQLEEVCGPLPLTLRLFYEEVGSIDLRQSQGQLVKWMDHNRADASPLLLIGEEDPLVVFPVRELAAQIERKLPQLCRNYLDPPGTSRLYCCLAPDECHKANYSGGENYNVYLPEPSIDFPLVGAWLHYSEAAPNENQYPIPEYFGPSEFFVSYLRQCIRGAGFRGRTDPENSGPRQPPMWNGLQEIARELLPV